ncbi:hypothetical protein [Kiloniella sp.]|uniref:hypothetical protein n=1 Tax=Kiloniella sp. TaxID=1938587 RepID=UPI003A8DC9AF
MLICLLDRESFLDWLGGKPSPKPVRLTANKMRQNIENNIALIYDDPKFPTSNQPIISIPQDKISDFYAFVGTYVKGFTPFSAFFKVVPFELLPELLNAPPYQQGMSLQFECLIGVAIAEVYTQSRARLKAIEKISVSAVQATLSASLIEAVWQGYTSERISDISDRWQTARELEDSSNLFLNPQKITEIWEIISEVITEKNARKPRGSRKKIVQALKHALLTNASSQEYLSSFMKEFPNLAKNVAGLSRSREERVRIVRNVLPELFDSSSDLLTREFLAGTIISMIGNGSFAQLSLLDDVLPKLPAAALWFGVVSSLQNGNDALTVGNCLGRRVVRDMCSNTNIFVPIREDIAIEELKMFRSESKSAHLFRTVQTTSMTVNLLGNVSGRFKTGGAVNNELAQGKRDTTSPDNQEKIQEVIYLLDRARRAVEKLSRNRQRDLFDEK